MHMTIELFDTIKITRRIRTKYLIGQTATVIGKDAECVWVLLNKRNSKAGTRGFPFIAVERVADPSAEDIEKAAQIKELVELGLMKTR